MKIFVAGATGVIGRLLLPKLVKRGPFMVGSRYIQHGEQGCGSCNREQF